MPGKTSGWAFALIAVAALAIAPLWLGTYPRYVISVWLIFALSAVGLNIPIGLASIYSFGHGGFMLIGAYATGVATISWGWPLLPAMLLAVVIAIAVGALIGLPSLRLTGFSLAIVTFAFGYMLFHVVKAFDLTGGPQGLFMPETALARAWGGRPLYYMVLAIFVVGVFWAHSIATGKTGRALRTLGTNEIVAQSLGINLLRAKMLSFMLSGVYGAVAGSLLALVTTYVAPETYTPELSINMFAAVMIGGSGTLVGPILGALFIVLIPELTQSAQNLSEIIYALIFCLVATLFPSGLLGMAKSAIRRLRPQPVPAAVRE
ncbi:branched-chain amino acid ABC transporter permease [Vineibacter terrae]|uniref:Branched-chain amino acid ABC transporter permease n=1 Tax=Vineibacter terrae TaxID=2586908 RepID=A0A5C8PDA3_9HYPH|nr:branched-chain amino acid ABC transporter permease [Vineibacter terrae]TXL71365.1 branched-chain amino acid ABC transporter permease [Vineibacter terrae]